MAATNQKLSQRIELTDPADNDFQHIVDVSDTTDSPEGSSKKVTWTNIKDKLFSFLKQKDVYETTYNGKQGQVATVGFDATSGNLGMKFQIMPTYTDIVGGNSVLTGGITHISGLTYRAWASKYVINNIVYNTFISDTVTLADGDAINPRFDTIAVQVDANEPPTATIEVIEGTPALNPLKPTINLQTQVELSFVSVAAAATFDPNVTLDQIYDENTGEPTEWDNLALQIGGDLAYTTDPFIGSNCIKLDPTSGGTTSWQKDAMYTFNSSESLLFAMKSGAVAEQNTQITIELNNSVSGQYYNINLILDNLINYGFDSSVTDWQVLTIPLSNFSTQFAPSEFDIIKFQFTNSPILFLDWIGIQGGLKTVEPTPPNNEPVLRTVKTTISAAQIKTANTTPIQIAPSGGIGTFLKPISVVAKFNYGTTPFSNEYYYFYYTGIANDVSTDVLDILFNEGDINVGSSSDFFSLLLPRQLFTSPPQAELAPRMRENLGIEFWTEADSSLTGDSTMDIYLTYEIVTL